MDSDTGKTHTSNLNFGATETQQGMLQVAVHLLSELEAHKIGLQRARQKLFGVRGAE